MMKSIKIIAAGLVALLIWSVSVSADVSIYLVRHAEKQKTSNPSLTKVGKMRAQVIAKFLKGRNIVHIYSTNYNRTLETAEPTAKLFGIETKLYDPRRLRDFASQLHEVKANILVVGHSNTTPQLFNYLTGENYPDLKEHQYDHLYEVVLKDNGSTSFKIHYLEPRTPE